MHCRTISLLLVLAALQTACGTAMPTPRSGFLSSYADLAESTDAASARRAPGVALDGRRITLSGVVWRTGPEAALSAADQARLTAVFEEALQDHLHRLPTAADGQAATVRVAITRIEPVSVALNTVATLLLIGPFDRGGAAVEIEAVDPVSGRQLAAMTQGCFAPLSELSARFSRLAPAEIALRKAAGDFVQLLQPEPVVSQRIDGASRYQGC